MTVKTAPDPDAPAAPAIRSQIPRGVQDRFLGEAARRRAAEAALCRCFGRWGYQEVIPPSFEYHENLVVGASDRLQQAMYRFFDQRGRTLALRADFTPQVARMAATKLFDLPMPLRCSYLGSLFRYEEPQAGRKREFTQAGVELLGADTPAADAEVVALAVAAMEALDLGDFQINLGQMSFFRALTAGLPGDALSPIREAIDHKSGARLDAALARTGLDGRRRALLQRLPHLAGGPEVLDEARSSSAGLDGCPGAGVAIERLARVYALLEAYGVAGRVTLDLGEVRGMDYYTGITLRGVAPGLGWPIASGGRYDDLIVHFGRPLAAVGFGLGIERALLVQHHRGAPPPPTAAHVLVAGCDHAACLGLVQRLRRGGCRVEVDLLGQEGPGLAEQAGLRGIPRVLACDSGGWRLTDSRGERTMTEAGVWQEAATWREAGPWPDEKQEVCR